MKAYVSFMEGLSKVVKLIFCIPFLDILWAIYRVCKSGSKGNMLGVVLAIVLIIVGIPFLWLVDLITLLLYDKVLWID